MKTKSNIAKELAALKKMLPAELRDRYADLYGEPSRSGNKQWSIISAWRRATSARSRNSGIDRYSASFFIARPNRLWTFSMARSIFACCFASRTGVSTSDRPSETISKGVSGEARISSRIGFSMTNA